MRVATRAHKHPHAHALELAEPGTRGRLELRAERPDHDILIEDAGEYVYVGVVRGMQAFAPATCEAPVIYLHTHEVVRFEAGA